MTWYRYNIFIGFGYKYNFGKKQGKGVCVLFELIF